MVTTAKEGEEQEKSDCTHLSRAVMGEQQQQPWEVAELKPAIAATVAHAEHEAQL